MSDDTKQEAKLDIVVRTSIAAVAAAATPEDRARVAAVIDAAIKSSPDQPFYSIELFSPAACAVFFLEHNPHNRDFRAGYALELERAIRAGQWQFNNATIGFYQNGDVSDGQHRLASKALAGDAFRALVVAGMERGAIVTTDTNARRSAGDAGQLEGIPDAKTKQRMVKATTGYLIKSGKKDAALKNDTEVLARMRADDDKLTEAILIGRAATDRTKIVTPVLDHDQCENLAYLLLASGWPNQEVRNHLASFQTGMSKDGESTPFFVAAQWIADARKTRKRGEQLSRAKELGVVVLALQLTVQGMTAVQKKRFQDGVRKELPNPSFPLNPGATEVA
jgi:hypothetical protein